MVEDGLVLTGTVDFFQPGKCRIEKRASCLKSEIIKFKLFCEWFKINFELCQEGEKTFDERYQILKELEEAQKRYDCIEEKLRYCEKIRVGKWEGNRLLQS